MKHMTSGKQEAADKHVCGSVCSLAAIFTLEFAPRCINTVVRLLNIKLMCVCVFECVCVWPTLWLFRELFEKQVVHQQVNLKEAWGDLWCL